MCSVLFTIFVIQAPPETNLAPRVSSISLPQLAHQKHCTAPSLTRQCSAPPLLCIWPSPSNAKLHTIFCLISSFKLSLSWPNPHFLSLCLSPGSHVMFQAPPPTDTFVLFSLKASNTILVFNSPRIYFLWRGHGGCGACVGLLCPT